MSESYVLNDLDRAFLQQFESRTLPFAKWTHRAHIRVSYLYARQYSFEKSLRLIGERIRAYNAANNVPEGPTSGYNETTTHAFHHLVTAVMRAYDKTHSVTDSESFCDMHPQLMSKHVLRFFYSPDRRMHPKAKSQFVEPDLAQLPTILNEGETEEEMNA